MSYVSREIYTRQCCCTVCTTFRCHCHNLQVATTAQHDNSSSKSSPFRTIWLIEGGTGRRLFCRYSQEPAEVARPRTRGRCIAQSASVILHVLSALPRYFSRSPRFYRSIHYPHLYPEQENFERRNHKAFLSSSLKLASRSAS